MSFTLILILMKKQMNYFFENSITAETKIKGIIAVGEFMLKEINGNK